MGLRTSDAAAHAAIAPCRLHRWHRHWQRALAAIHQVTALPADAWGVAASLQHPQTGMITKLRRLGGFAALMGDGRISG